MPLPSQIPDTAAPHLQLVKSLPLALPAPGTLSRPKPAPAPHELFLSARLLAHLVDLFVVQGVALFTSRLLTMAFLSAYQQEIRSFGQGADSLLADVFAHGSAQLYAGSFSLVTVLYFVAVPAVCGRTLGLGLVGLKIVSDDGAHPSPFASAWRLSGCGLAYLTAGAVNLTGLRRRRGALVQDQLSGTKVVRSAG